LTVTSVGAVAAEPWSAGTVLLVEDEHNIGKLVRSYLERDGYDVVWTSNGEDALVELSRHPVRIVVLDIGLPTMDGFEVCRRIRARSGVPILMLTARDEEPDRVAGLEVGADDYVTKPFSPRELVARVRAILRRVGDRAPEEVLVLGPLALQRRSRVVTVAGRPVELTTKEFELLACLLEHPHMVLSRDQLLERVWGFQYYGGSRTVDVHIAQIRRKLGLPSVIRTVRGAGYKAVSP
jgi:DNA-binding response OmpR family regulator